MVAAAFLRRFKKILLFVGICAAAFVVIEGLSSSLLVAHKLLTASRKPLAERVHTKYDDELGWVAIPSLHVPDLFGPGIYLRSNSRGFRNDEEFALESPPGKVRVICSGDSFTLGWGVDNDHTWCQMLNSLDGRLQTVNMGQSGYGVDQAYLWYKRDGSPLQHQIHLFTFITDDFTRMQWDNFAGYGKPVLKAKYGPLVIENVPVPRGGYRFPWLTQNSRLLRGLRSVELIGAILAKFSSGAPGTLQEKLPLAEVRQTAVRVFEDLDELNRRKHSTLVLVHLPGRDDYEGGQLTDSWRHFVGKEAAMRGIPFIDLVEDFQNMPRGEIEKMFCPPEELEFPGALRHYTAVGHRIIAERLYARLMALPEVSTSLPERR